MYLVFLYSRVCFWSSSRRHLLKTSKKVGRGTREEREVLFDKSCFEELSRSRREISGQSTSRFFFKGYAQQLTCFFPPTRG